MLVGYFKKIGAKRLLIMVAGNIFLGMGISIFKFSGLGNDPFSGMVMALAECVKIEYANFLIMLNVFIFLAELLFGREFIGAGTVVNAFLLGYIVTFFYNIWLALFPLPTLLAVRIAVVLIGMVITGFGISLYQTPNVGTAPYDSLSLIMAKRMPKISYFWHRICTDAVCALVCFLAGGIVGLGTLVTAFGFGPVIEFFNVHFTRKLFHQGENIL
jgi:Predicted membrane protein